MAETKQETTSGPASNDRVYIIDIEMAKVVSNYPLSDDQGFVKLMRLYYAMNNQAPKMSDFKALLKDDVERPCYGTIDVRVDDSTGSKAKDIAIYKFINNVLKFRTNIVTTDEKAKEAEDKRKQAEAQKYQESPVGLRQSYYIYADIDSPEKFAALRDAFHARDERLYHNDFMIVGGRVKKDLAVCEHKINLEEVAQQGWKPSQVNMVEIERHICKCLKKPPTPQEQRNRPDAETRQGFAKVYWPVPVSAVDTDDRTKIPDASWQRGHPLFRHCKYRECQMTDQKGAVGKTALVLLDEKELGRLDPKIREIYARFEQGKGTKLEYDALVKHFMPKILQMRADYQQAGYDILPFTLYKTWSAFELLKAFIAPPDVRAPLEVTWPAFKIPEHNFAFHFRTICRWVSSADPSGASSTSRGGDIASSLSSAILNLDLSSTESKKKKGAGGAKGAKTTKGESDMLVVAKSESAVKFMNTYYKGGPPQSQCGQWFTFKSELVKPFLYDLSLKTSFPYEALMPKKEPIGSEEYDKLLPLPSGQIGLTGATDASAGGL